MGKALEPAMKRLSPGLQTYFSVRWALGQHMLACVSRQANFDLRI